MIATTSMSAFIAVYNAIRTVILFDHMWKNGTVYLYHEVDHEMSPGKIAKSVDNLGQPFILIGTRFDTCIVFKRYIGDSDVVVSNIPQEIYAILGWGSPSPLTADEVNILVGNPEFPSLYKNISARLEDLQMIFGAK